MKAALTFERQLLFFDEHRYNNAIQQYYTRNMAAMNKALPKVEIALKRSLTGEEKVSVAVFKSEGVMRMLRDNFPFKNSDDDFNLRAIGLHIQPLLNEINSINGLPQDVESLSVKEGQVCLSDQFLQILQESCSIYTSSEKQNEAINVAEDVVKALEAAKEIGLQIDFHTLARSLPFVNFSGDLFGRDTTMAVERKQISYVKE